MSVSLIRFIPAAILIAAGVAAMAVAACGVFRIRYALNRLHAAAIGDSLGLPLVGLGLAILYGWSLAAVKALLIVVLFWLSSPVCSHLLSTLEASTNDRLSEDCQIMPLSELDAEPSERGDE